MRRIPGFCDTSDGAAAAARPTAMTTAIVVALPVIVDAVGGVLVPVGSEGSG